MKEIIYSIFIFSASIKVILDRNGISMPFDITLLTGIILIIYATMHLSKERNIKIFFVPAILSLIMFFFFMLFTLCYSSSIGYSFEKCIYFVVNIIAYFFPIVFYKTFDINKFFKFSVFFAIIISLIYFLGRNVYGNVLNDYIVIAQLFQVALILSISFENNIVRYLFIVILAISIMLLGARAIMLTSVLIPLMLIPKRIKLKLNPKYVLAISIVMVLVLVVSISYIKPFFKYSMERLFLLENFFNDESVMERVSQYIFVLEKYICHPFRYLWGYGIGSFGMEYFGADIRAHPHNIFLEVLFELGLIGLFLLLMFLYFNAKNIVKLDWQNNKNYRLVCIAIFLLFLNTLKSSSIDGQRDLFCFLSLLSVFRYRSHESKIDFTEMESNGIIK